MPSLYPFRGVHPSRAYVNKVFISHENAANLARSQAEAKSNPISFLHVTHPEYDCSEADKANAPDDTDSCCLSRSRKKFNEFEDRGILERDGENSLYVYRLNFRGRDYTGIVGCVDVEDYKNGRILRHEKTQEVKAFAQMRQLRICGINAEPVLLTYHAENFDFTPACRWASSHESMFRFQDGDTSHEIWRVSDPEWIKAFCDDFSKTRSLYVCDGHHRIAAAALYADNGGGPEARKLLASVFPPTQMTIFDYNRTVRDFGSMSDAEFIAALEANSFKVEKLGGTPAAPKKYLEFTMVTGGTWYRLTYTGAVPDGNPVERMNISILREKVFKGILGIDDANSEGRLGFVNGMRGLEDLQKEASTRMRAGFAIPPVTMSEFMAVAEAGLAMPPKSTCFAPKPVSGMIIHDIA